MSESYEDDIIMISAIEHYAYCPRQFVLMYLEQVFDDNVFTLQGTAEHERVDEAVTTYEEGKRLERALPLWSLQYGLQGRGDMVEFADDGSITPVEYKHGSKRQRQHDDLQLVAQALCLEEMFGVAVTKGAIFYHQSRRRREVLISNELRAATIEALAAMRDLMRSGQMPPPANDARCENCSLINACQPALLASARARHDDPLFRLPPDEAG